MKHSQLITEIKTTEDYNQALQLVENLIEDYDQNESLINLLSVLIEKWEPTSEEFKDFRSSLFTAAEQTEEGK